VWVAWLSDINACQLQALRCLTAFTIEPGVAAQDARDSKYHLGWWLRLLACASLWEDTSSESACNALHLVIPCSSVLKIKPVIGCRNGQQFEIPAIYPEHSSGHVFQPELDSIQCRRKPCSHAKNHARSEVRSECASRNCRISAAAPHFSQPSHSPIPISALILVGFCFCTTALLKTWPE
jgi:hypothetical protein